MKGETGRNQGMDLKYVFSNKNLQFSGFTNFLCKTLQYSGFANFLHKTLQYPGFAKWLKLNQVNKCYRLDLAEEVTDKLFQKLQI